VLQSWRGGWPDEAKLHTLPADISKAGDCQSLASFTQDDLRRVDVLINCAGYFPMVPFEKLTAQDWQRVIDINLTGTFLVTQAVLPLMKDRGWGRIVNFGSGSVFDGNPGHAHYVAAKAGVVGFSRSLAREVGGCPRQLPASATGGAAVATGHPARRSPGGPRRPGVLPGLLRQRLHLRPDPEHRRRHVHAVTYRSATPVAPRDNAPQEPAGTFVPARTSQGDLP